MEGHGHSHGSPPHADQQRAQEERNAHFLQASQRNSIARGLLPLQPGERPSSLYVAVERLFVECSMRCTVKSSSEMQPLKRPQYHAPTKICATQVAPTENYAEFRLKLNIQHTNCHMTAILHGMMYELQKVIPAKILHVHAPQQPNDLKVLPRPPGIPNDRLPPQHQQQSPPDQPLQHPPHVVRINQLLRFLDMVCCEASRRCTTRTLEKSQPFFIKELHLPSRVCADPLPNGTFALTVRHLQTVSIQTVFNGSLAELRAIIPANILHVHEVDPSAPVPTPPHIVEAIKQAARPHIPIHDQSEDHEDDEMCVVCHGQMEKGEMTVELQCNHVFHLECVLPWLKTRSTCPLCRTNLVMNQAVPTSAVASSSDGGLDSAAGASSGSAGAGAAVLSATAVASGSLVGDHGAGAGDENSSNRADATAENASASGDPANADEDARATAAAAGRAANATLPPAPSVLTAPHPGPDGSIPGSNGNNNGADGGAGGSINIAASRNNVVINNIGIGDLSTESLRGAAELLAGLSQSDYDAMQNSLATAGAQGLIQTLTGFIDGSASAAAATGTGSGAPTQPPPQPPPPPQLQPSALASAAGAPRAASSVTIRAPVGATIRVVRGDRAGDGASGNGPDSGVSVRNLRGATVQVQVRGHGDTNSANGSTSTAAAAATATRVVTAQPTTSSTEPSAAAAETDAAAPAATPPSSALAQLARMISFNLTPTSSTPPPPNQSNAGTSRRPDGDDAGSSDSGNAGGSSVGRDLGLD